MSKLLIKYSSDEVYENQVRVPLEVINGDLQQVEGISNLFRLGSIAEIDLEPGNYLIRLHLPNQQLISKQVLVIEGETNNVNLKAKYEPNKNTFEATALSEISGRSIRKHLYSWKDVVDRTHPFTSNLRIAVLRHNDHTFSTFPLPKYLDQQSRLFSPWELSDLIRRTIEDLSDGITPGTSCQYFLAKIGNKQEIGKSTRYYLIPPLTQTQINFFTELENLPGHKKEFGIVISSSSAQATALLSFLMRGNYHAINQLSEEVFGLAEGLVLGKRENPIDAVIGGYLLIKAGNISRLHDWTYNLKNWFPDIPDGAVIHAWFLLMGESEKSNEALESLLQAVERGIPYLSQGVQLLFDGLTFFKNHNKFTDKVPIEKAIAKIAPWIRSVDWNSSFTVLQGSDYFNPGDAIFKHEGNLPIRALKYNILQFFQNAHPFFKNELLSEIQTNKLSNKILYDDSKEAITDLAKIWPDITIAISEPYLGFLWTLSHLAVCFYYEQKSEVTELVDNDILYRSVKVFEYGNSLFTNWSEWDFELPNPEQPNLLIDKYIPVANAIFILASTYVLYHEYSHHFLKHDLNQSPDYKNESIFEELAADKHALDILLKGVSSTDVAKEHTTIVGIVIGICSLLFGSESWSGGDTHPDTDDRIILLIEYLTPNDSNNESWAWVVTTVYAWSIINKKAQLISVPSTSPKEEAIDLLKQLKAFQK